MKKVSVCFSLLLIGLLGACYKEKTFDIKPYIEFKEISKKIIIDSFEGSKKDSITISIKFQDGDGDLGLNEDERKIAIQKSDYNYKIRLFRKKKGVFQEIFPIVPYSGFFIRLKNDNKLRPIEGVLDYSLTFGHNFTPAKDSLKFEISIKDRAGNLSNTVETKVIVLNEF